MSKKREQTSGNWLWRKAARMSDYAVAGKNYALLGYYKGDLYKFFGDPPPAGTPCKVFRTTPPNGAGMSSHPRSCSGPLKTFTGIIQDKGSLPMMPQREHCWILVKKFLRSRPLILKRPSRHRLRTSTKCTATFFPGIWAQRH